MSAVDPRLARILARPDLIEAEMDRRLCGRLIVFVRRFWSIIEPMTPFAEGWALDAMCEHLEAVTAGQINRLLINVPPGSMKSLLVNVFWPAWEWGPMRRAHLRYVAFSYAASLTERDNRRFLSIVSSPRYQRAWGDKVALAKQGEALVTNRATGFKLASSVGGVGTGERGNRVLLDDPHNVKDQESKPVREGTVEWFRTAMSNRLNDLRADAIIVVMQRVHQADVSGAILDDMPEYEHLMIPAEYEAGRGGPTSIGWSDPRTVEGESYWDERYPPETLRAMARTLGPYAYAGQYQQRPEAKGGGILQRDWWGLWSNPDDPDDPKFRRYPICDPVVVSFDGAYSERSDGDPTAVTVWGRFLDEWRRPRAILMHAWAERLAIHDAVQKLLATARRWKATHLLIENKATGISVQQELIRLQGDVDWAVTMIDPSRQGDKVSRAYSVQHLFANGMVFCPDRQWADMVISQCAVFPRGEHDDLVDTTTQALRWLRDNGLLQIAAESDAEIASDVRRPTAPPPLYPV